jgi:hypothetical protein
LMVSSFTLHEFVGGGIGGGTLFAGIKPKHDLMFPSIILSLLFLWFLPAQQDPTSCEKCKYVIPVKGDWIDGDKLKLQPGDTICLDGGTLYNIPLRFKNIRGTEDNPVTIINCNGIVNVTVPSNLVYGVRFEQSQYFRFTGSGEKIPYGIRISGANKLGVTFDNKTSDFEADHLEISDVGFAGIMAKTDPTCDSTTTRGYFTMRNVNIHHNLVHHTGGEGLYIGNSFYSTGAKTPCGPQMPHDLENIRIHSNIIRNTGWEAIQLGGAVRGAEIFNNIVEDYGEANNEQQNNGIQIGEGTGGLCYNNYIHSGNGNGIIVLGIGDNVLFNNIIVNAGGFGIFCDDRYVTGDGFSFINNTIIHPKRDGIRLYADQVRANSVINNLIVDPGSYDEYELDKTSRVGNDAYLYLLSTKVKVNKSKNFFTREGVGTPRKCADLMADLSGLQGILMDGLLNARSGKPKYVDAGDDVSARGVTFDFFNRPRPSGKGYDIGAIEFE